MCIPAANTFWQLLGFEQARCGIQGLTSDTLETACFLSPTEVSKKINIIGVSPRQKCSRRMFTIHSAHQTHRVQRGHTLNVEKVNGNDDMSLTRNLNVAKGHVSHPVPIP